VSIPYRSELFDQDPVRFILGFALHGPAVAAFAAAFSIFTILFSFILLSERV
jgi:hypothetical protein